MGKIKALHIASFNGNIGDNANHNGFRRKLREVLDCEVQYDEVEIREFYQSWGIRSFNTSEFVNLCNDSDLVIIGGGNYFELKWDYSATGTTINITDDTLNKIKTPIFFNSLGCDVAKGASKSAINKFGAFLDTITSSKKYLVSVRNDGSYYTIQNLYGNKYDNKVLIAPDGAFFLKTKSFVFPELNNNLKSMGINIVYDMKEHRFSKDINYDEFIDGISENLNDFLRQNELYQIIFFPHIYSDLIAISKVLEKMHDRFRRTRVVVAPYLTGKGSEEYIFGLYKKCEFVLGMRFHSNVCSITQELPTIALCSYKKIHDLYAELGLLDRIIYVNEKGFQKKLEYQIRYIMDNLEEIRLKYKEVNRKIEDKGNNFYDQVKKWVKGNKVI